MSHLAGASENGWAKSILKGNLTMYTTQLTHIVSTSSNVVTGLLPSEVINHIFQQFSNIHLYAKWGSGTKTTTFNLILLDPKDNQQVTQAREGFASASRASGLKAAMIVHRNLYSADGAFVDTTNLISPYMIFQDLAGAGSGTNTLDISLVFAQENVIPDSPYHRPIGETL